MGLRVVSRFFPEVCYTNLTPNPGLPVPIQHLPGHHFKVHNEMSITRWLSYSGVDESDEKDRGQKMYVPATCQHTFFLVQKGNCTEYGREIIKSEYEGRWREGEPTGRLGESPCST